MIASDLQTKKRIKVTLLTLVNIPMFAYSLLGLILASGWGDIGSRVLYVFNFIILTTTYFFAVRDKKWALWINILLIVFILVYVLLFSYKGNQRLF